MLKSIPDLFVLLLLISCVVNWSVTSVFCGVSGHSRLFSFSTDVDVDVCPRTPLVHNTLSGSRSPGDETSTCIVGKTKLISKHLY